MKKIFIKTLLLLSFGWSAKAGYLPPPESPFWCYEDCIYMNSNSHQKCVDECYPDDSPVRPPSPECKGTAIPPHRPVGAFGAACCSWGENIQGCMPGC